MIHRSFLEIRGGFGQGLLKKLSFVQGETLLSPDKLSKFIDISSVALLGLGLLLKYVQNPSSCDSKVSNKSQKVISLQRRFLPIFWLLRLADWLQGPYFYEVYSSKVHPTGQRFSSDLISKLFLLGFATTGAIGPIIGRFIDSRGRRLGTLLYVFHYSLAALSTRSSSLAVLVTGRLLSGLGTSFLFSAPEAWLGGEFEKLSPEDRRWIGQTFGWAFAADSLVAILAGQLASFVAHRSGPTAPFLLSVLVLLAAGPLVWLVWTENRSGELVGPPAAPLAPVRLTSGPEDSNAVSIAGAVQLIRSDRNLQLLGLAQASYEAAMYLFVLQWAPAVKTFFPAQDQAASIPFGKIFSSFMACCLLGSSLFTRLQSHLSAERLVVRMVGLAVLAMAAAVGCLGRQGGGGWLVGLLLSFFAFETTVGLYFPAMGLLRARHLPEAQRSLLMNLFALPLNLLVALVFAQVGRLGLGGSLSVAAGLLAVSWLCLALLRRRSELIPPSADGAR